MKTTRSVAVAAVALAMMFISPPAHAYTEHGKVCGDHGHYTACAFMGFEPANTPDTINTAGNFTTLGGQGVDGRAKRISLQRKRGPRIARINTYGFVTQWSPSYSLGVIDECRRLGWGYYRAAFVHERRADGASRVITTYTPWVAKARLCRS